MGVVEYCRELVAFDSTSSLSNVPVTDYVQRKLTELGFTTERIEYDDEAGVRKANVVGKRGPGTGGVAYFGHTDVVPADDWLFPDHGPYQATIRGDKLHGRGTCDMKGSVACLLAAVARSGPGELKRPIYVTCTADEEIGYAGARAVATRSRLYREMVEGKSHGIVGEPTSLEVVHAHKGTYAIVATSRGKAAHSSSRAGRNANLAMIPFLVEMKAIHDETESNPAWHNPAFDPPTVTWNIGINDFTRAINITPPTSVCTVYFRPMPGQDPETLVRRARHAAERHGLEFTTPRVNAPFHVDPQSPYVRQMLELAARPASRTVAYGTDGCLFGELEHLVVCGPGDVAQAHTHDEWILLEQLERGAEFYAHWIDYYCR